MCAAKTRKRTARKCCIHCKKPACDEHSVTNVTGICCVAEYLFLIYIFTSGPLQLRLRNEENLNELMPPFKIKNKCIHTLARFFNALRAISYSQTILAIFKKEFSMPHQAPGPNFGETRDTCQIFFDSLPLCKISGLFVHPFRSSSHI